MKYARYRITKEALDKKKTTKPIDEVMAKHYRVNRPFHLVEKYFVSYNLVRTEDLVDMLQKLTIFDNFISYLKRPTTKEYERLVYLKELKQYLGIDFTDTEFEELMSIKNQIFIDSVPQFKYNLRQELATREHVPNKFDKKIIRRLKAQGKYVID